MNSSKYQLTRFSQQTRPNTETGLKKVCAVIPAFNEAETIGKIIKETKKYVDTVFVVNNNSTDNTAEVARQSGAKVIHCSGRQGYGAAQYIGHVTAMEDGFEYLLQLDADGQHDPKYIPSLLAVALSDNYDIVLGSRFLGDNNSNVSFVRKIGIKFFSKVVSFLGHTEITDVTSGFKVYKVSSLKQLCKPSDTHPAVEQMLEIAKRGMKIKEVPIEMLIRNNGKSHLNLIKFTLYPLRGIWAVLKVMLFRRVSRLSETGRENEQ